MSDWFETFNSSFPQAVVTVPDAPTGVVATQIGTSTSINVAATAPSNNGGATIISYIATLNPGGLTGSSATPNNIVVNGAILGTAYTATVVAVNSKGPSLPSGASSPITPTGLPGTPTNISASPGVSRVIIVFSGTAVTGGSPITGYLATASTGQTQTGDINSPSNGITILGLTAGVPVTVTVQAQNINGNGPASLPSNSVTPTATGVPDAPIIGTASVNGTTITITFTPPANDGGSAITQYALTYLFNGSVRSPGLSTPSSPYIMTGAQAGTWQFAFRAANAFGFGPLSAYSNAVVVGAAGAQSLYANGVFDPTFPASNDLSFAMTITSNYTGPNVCPGSTQSMQLVANSVFGGGWQPGSLWRTIPPNGFDTLPYTKLQFSINTPVPANMSLSAHYPRSTGNDIGISTSATQGSSYFGIPANTWTTVTVPLTAFGSLGCRNFYKFSLGPNVASTLYVDNVQWIQGNQAWVFQGTGAPAASWTDASVNAAADYTWLPQSLNPGVQGLFAINSPSALASQFVASCAGNVMTVTSLQSGAINIGDTACWLNNLGGSSSPTITGGAYPNYTLSTSQTVNSQEWSSAPAQALITGIKLTSTVVGATLKLRHPSFLLTPYTVFTMGAIPTKAGYGYQVQFYDTTGAAVGNAVNAATYTQHQFGISTGSFTVYDIPLSAFGTLPANIGGVSIKETSANAANTTYFSAIGFYS